MALTQKERKMAKKKKTEKTETTQESNDEVSLFTSCETYSRMTETEGWRQYVQVLVEKKDELKKAASQKYDPNNQEQVGEHVKNAKALKAHLEFIDDVVAPIKGKVDEYNRFVDEHPLLLQSISRTVAWDDKDLVVLITTVDKK